MHLSGTETITGTKTFAASPKVPTPTSSGAIANKGYVDQSVSNVGSGSYLSTAGGTMTGPITLPANPAAPLQAATKQYVDLGLTSKADLIAGLVPTSELGTGTASAGNLLVGQWNVGRVWERRKCFDQSERGHQPKHYADGGNAVLDEQSGRNSFCGSELQLVAVAGG